MSLTYFTYTIQSRLLYVLNLLLGLQKAVSYLLVFCLFVSPFFFFLTWGHALKPSLDLIFTVILLPRIPIAGIIISKRCYSQLNVCVFVFFPFVLFFFFFLRKGLIL